MINYLSKYALLSGGLLIFLLLMQSCYYDTRESLAPFISAPCDTATVTYSLHIKPIMDADCVRCHTASFAQGNVDVDGYDQILPYAQDGSLIGCLEQTDPQYSPMPEAGKLSDCKIEMVRTWIVAGALNN